MGLTGALLPNDGLDSGDGDLGLVEADFFEGSFFFVTFSSSRPHAAAHPHDDAVASGGVGGQRTSGSEPCWAVKSGGV